MPRKSRKEASDLLLWIQKLVRCCNYELSERVFNKIAEGDFSREDIENSIFCGNIRKREKDEKKVAKDGYKYTICGPGVNGLAFETVGKLIDRIDGETYFIITAYGRT